MYVRFVVGSASEDHRQLNGVFTHAYQLRNDGLLAEYEVEWAQETLDWFKHHLPVPPYSSSNWPDDVKAWFKVESQPTIERMWDLIAILRGHDLPVRMLRSKSPGWLYYEDDFQIVVEEYPRL